MWLGYRRAMGAREGVVTVWKCRVLGHRPRFDTAGSTMTWSCKRHCGSGGSKPYGSAEQAARYAAALNRRDGEELGRRAPLIGLFPLRLWRRLRTR